MAGSLKQYALLFQRGKTELTLWSNVPVHNGNSLSLFLQAFLLFTLNRFSYFIRHSRRPRIHMKRIKYWSNEIDLLSQRQAILLTVHFGNSLSLPVSVIAIGAFDGVHRGHQKLIDSALQQANELQVPLVVYTFDPPPKVYFQNAMRLTSLMEKLYRFDRLGAHYVVVEHFDILYSSRGAEDFHTNIRKLNPLGIWVGSDFMYGVNRQGNVNTLGQHFSVHTVEPVCCDSGEVIVYANFFKKTTNPQ